MDETRRLKVKYLERCSFLPGSYEKRFVRDMASRPDDEELSIRQAHFIDVLYWKYRKQIGGMSGTDKPEVFRPGDLSELFPERQGYIPATRRLSRYDRQIIEAKAKLDDWNLRAGKYLEEAELAKRVYHGWPGPYDRIVGWFEDKLWEAGCD